MKTPEQRLRRLELLFVRLVTKKPKNFETVDFQTIKQIVREIDAETKAGKVPPSLREELEAKIDDLDNRLHRIEQMVEGWMPAATLTSVPLRAAELPTNPGQLTVLPEEPEQPVLNNGGNIFWTPLGSTAHLNNEERKIADNHNLDDLRQKETFELIGFVCRGCGKTYTSIQDRTLRQPGPGGCDGCLLKAKWG